MRFKLYDVKGVKEPLELDEDHAKALKATEHDESKSSAKAESKG